MDKIKDNKTYELLNEMTSAFDMLRNSLNTFDAFRIIFIIFHYKAIESRYEKFAKSEPGFVKNNEGLISFANSGLARKLFLQIYMALRNISAESLGLRYTELDPIILDNELGSKQELMGIKYEVDIDSVSMESKLLRIPKATKENILKIFDSNNLSQKGFSFQEFEEVISKFEIKCMSLEGKMAGNHYMSPSLTKLIVKLLNPYSRECTRYPFCGLGQMATTAIDHTLEVSEPVYDDLSGPDERYPHNFMIPAETAIELGEKNKEILELTQLKIAAKLFYLNKKNEVHVDFKISNINPKSRADVIFLNPPLALHHPDHLPSKVNIDGDSLEIPRNNGELYELLHYFQQLSDHGRMSVLIPFSVLSAKGKVKKIREFLVGNDYVDAVIQLPANLITNTSIQTAIIVINKNKSESRKRKIFFARVETAQTGDTADISSEEINRVINTYKKAKSNLHAIATLAEILRLECDLTPGLYIDAFPDELEKLIHSDEAFVLKKISTILRGRSKKPSPSGNNGLPFITTKDLAKDVIDPYLNYDKCLLGVPQKHDKVLDKKCILVSLVGNTLKPTIFDPKTAYKGEPDQNGNYHNTHPGVLIGHNIVAITPNEQTVDIEYLYYQLYNPIVIKQFEMYIIGSGGIPRIALKSFDLIVIPVLRLIEDQRRSINQQKLLLLEVEKDKLEAVKTRLGISEKKQEAEFEIVGHLAHNIKPKINIVRSPIMAIYDFLEKENLLDKVVSTGRNSSKETARDILNIAKESLGLITNVLDSARDIVTREIERNKFQKTNIFDLFENNILPFYKNKTFNIVLVCKDKEIEAYLHIESFVDAIGNIIRNAEMHAFSDNIADPVLRFEIDEDINVEEIIIDYTNNGIPFPSSMSADEYLSFGKKSKNSKGDGLGGAWIGKVIEAHDGAFEIIRDNNPVHFRLTFPQGVQTK
jgi:type I restriction-modification system DNA methylase subunit